MAELLIPCSVAAKVISTAVSVPQLGPKPNTPFLVDPTQLQPGIHVHWALPDALTRARPVKGLNAHGTLFPGVPDLWLVVRLNPSTGSGARAWDAHVVDSRMQTVKPWNGWTLDTPRDPGWIHTAVGMLPADQTNPGWGYFDDRTQPDFDLTSIVYYPVCGKRFGYYDDRTGLGRTANVSYTVFGWYSIQGHDPLWNADNRWKLMDEWNLSYPNSRYQTIHAPVTPQQMASSPAWTVPVSVQSNPHSGSNARQLKVDSRAGKLQNMRRSFPGDPAANSTSLSEVQFVAVDNDPSEIRCHGSVVQVPLAAQGVPQSTLNHTPSLYPSIKRAMAGVAALQAATDGQVDTMEMLVQRLDRQRSTIAGLIDLAGAAHAASFQGSPGKSQYYAVLEIWPMLAVQAKDFQVVAAQKPGGKPSSGHWPRMMQRAAAMPGNYNFSDISAVGVYQPMKPGKPEPTDAEINDELSHWSPQVTGPLTNPANQWPQPLDPRMILVHDYRAKAQPYRLGPSIDGSGTNEAGSWLDTSDTAAMRQMYLSIREDALAGFATVLLPDPSRVHEVPGPRWYAPWSPQIVLKGDGRSYRFGEDGRYNEDGLLKCRLAGHTVSALVFGIAGALGRDMLTTSGQLAKTQGLPGVARAVVEEAALIDPDTSVLFKDAVNNLFKTYDPVAFNLSPTDIQGFLSVIRTGEMPSPVAIKPWVDPWDPIFLDASYALAPNLTIESGWTLEEEQVEFTQGAQPPANPVLPFQERSRVNATLVRVLESVMTSEQSLNMHGNTVKANSRPKNFDESAFKKAEILSAPLSSFDPALFDQGSRLRSGRLSLANLDLVDVFGGKRSWPDPKMLVAPPSIPLTPRLPYWSRLQFRLQSADGSGEATREHPPICGWLVPNFVEHSLEVFDGVSGLPLGRLRSDRPQFGNVTAKGGPNKNPVILKVWFDPYPWTPANYQWNPTLKALKDGLSGQGITIAGDTSISQFPKDEPADKAHYHETGLTAMLRIIDTLHATVDTTPAPLDRKAQLIGRPIAVLAVNLWMEATSASEKDLMGDPPPLASAALPMIPVRIGAATRPDDGVLGSFLHDPNNKDASACSFAPVSSEAASAAAFSGLLEGLTIPLDPKETIAGINLPVKGTTDGTGFANDHQFIVPSHVFEVTPNQQPITTTLLCDVTAGIYATCGALPRKKITMPREFLDGAQRALEPALRVGPFLTFNRGDLLVPVLPPPDIDGYGATLVYHDAAAVDAAGYPEVKIPAALAVNDLPPQRVTLSEGWYRLDKK